MTNKERQLNKIIFNARTTGKVSPANNEQCLGWYKSWHRCSQCSRCGRKCTWNTVMWVPLEHQVMFILNVICIVDIQLFVLGFD